MIAPTPERQVFIPGVRDSMARRAVRARLVRLLFACATGMALAGCAAATIGYGPNSTPLPSNMKRIGIFTPDITAFDVSSGGVPEYRVDWSGGCNRALAGHIAGELAKYGFMGIPVADSLDDPESRRIRDNLRLHCEVIANYLYGKHPFVPQIEKFDYSVGNIKPLCERFGVDAVMFVYGFDEHFSTERHAMLRRAGNVKVAKAVVVKALLFLLTGSVTLSVPEYRFPKERTFLCAIAASSDGSIVWYNRKAAADDADLSAGSKLGEFLQEFLTIRRRK